MQLLANDPFAPYKNISLEKLADRPGYTRPENPYINSLIGLNDPDGEDDLYWTDGVVTYSFPTDGSTTYFQEERTNFYLTREGDREAIRFALDGHGLAKESYAFSIEGFTNLEVEFLGTAPSMIESWREDMNGTRGGAWGPRRDNPNAANLAIGQHLDDSKVGNYAWRVVLHEIGHTLGIYHPHNGGVVLDPALDTFDHSVMSYYAIARDPARADDFRGYKTIEEFGAHQTYMSADIGALQHIYGADFTANAGNTVYKWTPDSGNTLINGVVALEPGANRIFMTIWDGNGTDTYDFSAYSNGVNVDLTPGASSTTMHSQKANFGHVDEGDPDQFAQGNVYNAYLYKGDQRSMIENAVGGSGADTIKGNAVANKLIGNDGNDKLYGDAGDDKLYGEWGDDILDGGAGKDRLSGHIGRDKLYGGADDDTLYGGSGDDMLNGQNHNDTLYGDSGNDSLHGEWGDDKLYGGNGDDWLYGHIGDDKLYGGSGNDMLNGNWGKDYLNGNGGDDRLYGGDHDDHLVGGWGNDMLNGQNHNDNLYGQYGDDRLYGEWGDDYLSGAEGNDTLDGGTGNDRLRGGSGADTFVFGNALGRDTILDFSTGQAGERIDLRAVSSIANYADLRANHLVADGNSTVIRVGGTDYIRVENVSMSSLTADDFIL